MAVAQLGFKRCATTVLKLNFIRSVEFGTAVAQHLKQVLGACNSNLHVVITHVSHVLVQEVNHNKIPTRTPACVGSC